MSADGTWEISMKTPMGQQKATLVLATDGGTLTGEMKSAMGSASLEDGTVAGDDLAWKAKVTSPMPLTLEFSAKVNGDAISGNAKLGAFGNASFEGTKSA